MIPRQVILVVSMSHATKPTTMGETTESESNEERNESKSGDFTGIVSDVDQPQLSKSEVFELLSAERRQEVLRYLDNTEGAATLSELAEHIASLECDCEPAQLSSQQRKRAYVGLYQCHLPKMADAGVIDYNADRGIIELNERSIRLLNYLYFEEESTSVTKELVTRLFG